VDQKSKPDHFWNNFGTNFLQCICAKNYENWLAVDKVIAKIIRLTFLAHPVYSTGCSKKVIPCRILQIFKEPLNRFG